MLVPETEFFWTSGADGVLRFRRCADCRSFQHPPGPVCRTCGSATLEPEPVSGRGVLVGFTVNWHTWSPELPPPYVIGIVAIDEDPRVRLTTNIVGVPIEDLAVGRRVEARFEQIEDVWLPMFSYASDGPGEGPLPEDEPVDQRVRPMVRTDKFEEKVALTGIGMSRLGRRLGVDPLGLTVEACRNAVADAGLSMADIDGLSTYPGGAAAGGHSEGGVTALEESLRLRPTWINGASETPGQGARWWPPCWLSRQVCADTCFASGPCGNQRGPSGSAAGRRHPQHGSREIFCPGERPTGRSAPPIGSP